MMKSPLSDEDKAKICGLNAIEFFGIETKCAGVAKFHNGLVNS